MLAFALGLLLIGWLLVWAGIRNRNPLDEVRAALAPSRPVRGAR